MVLVWELPATNKVSCLPTLSFIVFIIAHSVEFVKHFFQLFLKSFVVAISTTTMLDPSSLTMTILYQIKSNLSTVLCTKKGTILAPGQCSRGSTCARRLLDYLSSNQIRVTKLSGLIRITLRRPCLELEYPITQNLSRKSSKVERPIK